LAGDVGAVALGWVNTPTAGTATSPAGTDEIARVAVHRALGLVVINWHTKSEGKSVAVAVVAVGTVPGVLQGRGGVVLQARFASVLDGDVVGSAFGGIAADSSEVLRGPESGAVEKTAPGVLGETATVGGKVSTTEGVVSATGVAVEEKDLVIWAKSDGLRGRSQSYEGSNNFHVKR